MDFFGAIVGTSFVLSIFDYVPVRGITKWPPQDSNLGPDLNSGEATLWCPWLAQSQIYSKQMTSQHKRRPFLLWWPDHRTVSVKGTTAQSLRTDVPMIRTQDLVFLVALLVPSGRPNNYGIKNRPLLNSNSKFEVYLIQKTKIVPFNLLLLANAKIKILNFSILL